MMSWGEGKVHEQVGLSAKYILNWQQHDLPSWKC